MNDVLHVLQVWKDSGKTSFHRAELCDALEVNQSECDGILHDLKKSGHVKRHGTGRMHNYRMSRSFISGVRVGPGYMLDDQPTEDNE